MADNNPFFISTEGTGITFGQIDDLVDFPHSGIIKALNQMSKGNHAIKTTNGFNITQSSSDPIITVAAGQYFRDGRKYSASQTTFNAAAFTATSDNSYYLIVVDSSNVVRLRVPTATNRVAQFTAGDTIIAMLEYSSTTSNGARRVQFFTTEKAANTLSVGRDNSGYTESLEIFSNAGDAQIRAKESDKDMEFYVNDGGVDTLAFYINADVGGRVNGLKLDNQLFIKEQSSADTDVASLGQLWVKNEVPNALFFTDDTGQDTRITENGSLAVTSDIVRYRLTSDKVLTSGSRYTYTSGDFTAQTENTAIATFSGTTITLKGAGIFNIIVYGYFLGDAEVTAVGAQTINPDAPANPNAAIHSETQNAVTALQQKIDAMIGSFVEFDLSIGSASTVNIYAYNRTIMNLNYVVRMAQNTTASIKTTGDTVIKLSGYMVWPAGGSGTSNNPKLHGTSSFQATGFTIWKVA
jgi:hypothetical protein